MARATTAASVLAWIAAAFTLATVALGGVVCATKSGFDCHSWPGCYADRFAPGASDIPAILAGNPALEVVHRVTAMSTGLSLIVVALMSLTLKNVGVRVRLLPWLACLAAGGSALFGRASVLGLGVDAVGAAIDLLCALVAMTLALSFAVLVHPRHRFTLDRISSPALLATVLLVVLHVVGQLAAGNRSFTRCLSWPILWLASDDSLVIQAIRTGLALAAAACVVVAARAAIVGGRRALGVALGSLLASVLVLAVAYRASEADGGLLGVTFSLASVALLWVATLAACTGRRQLIPGDDVGTMPLTEDVVGASR